VLTIVGGKQPGQGKVRSLGDDYAPEPQMHKTQPIHEYSPTFLFKNFLKKQTFNLKKSFNKI
jgi:hypothetical protein